MKRIRAPDRNPDRAVHLDTGEVLESLGDGVFAVDREWRIVYLNRRAHTLLNRSADALLGVALWEAFPEISDSGFARACRSAMAGGPAQTVMEFHPGHGRWYEMHVYPALHGISVYAREISAVKPAGSDLTRLAAEADRQRLLMDAALSVSGDHKFVFDLQYRCIYANHSLLATWGLSLPDALGKRLGSLNYSAGAVAHIEGEFQRVVDTREAVRGEIKLQRACGLLDYEYIFVPVVEPDGTLVAIAGTSRDITERIRTAQRLSDSEARFRAVLETSIDGFMIFASVRDSTGSIVDFRWLYANEASERILGKPPSWFVGRLLLEEHKGNRDNGLFEGYVKVVESGQAWTHEFEYNSDGISAYFRIVAAKAGDGFAVTFADFSERRRMERRLRDSERQFVGLANAIPQLAWTERADGTPDYYNRGWYEYTGKSPGDLIGIDAWRSVLHPEDAPRVVAARLRSLRAGTAFEDEFRLRRLDGAYRWFLARIAADRDADGVVNHWYGTCTDIEAGKKTEQILRKTEAALREADMRKDVFLAILAHELRNPLAPIRTAATLLDSPQLGAGEISRIRGIITRQVVQMTSLLEDLLDVSRITRGILTLKKTTVRIRQVLDAAVETAQPLIDAKAHHLQIEMPATEIWLDADPVRLTQIVGNLLVNAAKYTDQGGRIDLRVRAAEDRVAVAVRDSGIGLSPEVCGTVFEMFTQAKQEKDRSEGGLGVGLALAKGLVELHGGQIEARSAGIGQGSEFVVTLPRLRGDVVREAAAGGAGVRGAGPRRILVADDNRDSAESLAMFLQLAGHEVYVAHSGPQALEIEARHRPEVSVLDIGMPGLSGYEVAKRLRRQSGASAMTLIAVTGWGQEGDKREALDAGFDYHFTKPVDPSALERVIAALTAHPGADRTA